MAFHLHTPGFNNNGADDDSEDGGGDAGMSGVSMPSNSMFDILNNEQPFNAADSQGQAAPMQQAAPPQQRRYQQQPSGGASGNPFAQAPQSAADVQQAARAMRQRSVNRAAQQGGGQGGYDQQRRAQQAAMMQQRAQEEAAERTRLAQMRRQAQRNNYSQQQPAQAPMQGGYGQQDDNGYGQGGYQQNPGYPAAQNRPAPQQQPYQDAGATTVLPPAQQPYQATAQQPAVQQQPAAAAAPTQQQVPAAGQAKSLKGMPGVFVSDDHFVVPQQPNDSKNADAERRKRLAAAVVQQMGEQYPDAPDDFVEAINQLTLQNASDLHWVVGAKPALRVDGRLGQMEDLKTLTGDDTWDVVKLMTTEEDRARFERELELDISFSIGQLERFRVNVFRDRLGVGLALRTIPLEIKNAKQLGLDPKIADLALLPRGLVLVCGPTGSGKSTTLAAIVDKANAERHDHIITIEDPIEFVHQHKNCIVNQREIGTDTKSFQEALKHALREDPDIILVGELRDLETISTALTAVETGHLVFATLHTQDAASTVDRLIDVYPENQQQQIRIQVAATLQAVIIQTLLPRASGHGRAPATEIMYSTPAIAALIRGAKTHQIRTQLQSGGELGMHTLDQDLARLVTKGVVSQEDAVKKCQVREEFDKLVARGIA